MRVESDPASTAIRLDVWLWAARFFKTRALAKQAVERGHVEIDGQARKPAASVRIGASLRIERAGERHDVLVLALAAQRGSASAAQMLYRETDNSRAAREAARAQRKAEMTGYRPPSGKPDKRARRLIRALGDIDAL